MDAKFEKLVNEIMKECEKDGEPVTRAEAEEMARYEIGRKQTRHYEVSEKPRKTTEKKPRKVDEVKKQLLEVLQNALFQQLNILTIMRNEVELNFSYEGEDYSLKLVKHRKEKK